jgi:hypothetical protein
MASARLLAIQILLLVAFFVVCSVAFAGNGQDVPSVNGDLGGCSAAFTVHGSSGKPIYDAKIDVTIRYGFMSMHETELQVGTNSNGKALLTGLPNSPKKPLAFQITSGDLSRIITYDPSTDCNATFDFTLAAHQGP